MIMPSKDDAYRCQLLWRVGRAPRVRARRPAASSISGPASAGAVERPALHDPAVAQKRGSLGSFWYQKRTYLLATYRTRPSIYSKLWSLDRAPVDCENREKLHFHRPIVDCSLSLNPISAGVRKAANRQTPALVLDQA